ncbi:MAG: sugar O-acetyltransferase, partial [Hoylesella buccalis]
MKTEFEKMRTEERYSFADPEIAASIAHAIDLCRQLQTITLTDERYRDVIERLIPGIPKSATICPPFHCDHGSGITIGEHTFLNYNCTILD